MTPGRRRATDEDVLRAPPRTEIDWATISPAGFGSIFQEDMDDSTRRQIGAHYTCERDILKVLRDLFLDELEQQLATAKRSNVGRQARLEQLHSRIASMKFLDPACGCGDFLIFAYREIRRIEQELLAALHDESRIDRSPRPRVSIDQFHGIELFEPPVEIARAGLILMEQRMDLALAAALGQPRATLPRSTVAPVVCANALRIDWADVLPCGPDVFVLGNPPFVGKKAQNAEQKHDMRQTWGAVPGAQVLDYASCWFRKAAEYIEGSEARCAFVATNSLTQGEQNSVLFGALAGRIKINFAHRTFAWTSETRGKAHVHVVIIGFSANDATQKRLYEYSDPSSCPRRVEVGRINSYLVEGPDITIERRSTPISKHAPTVKYGSFALDGGHFTLDASERDAIVQQHPSARKFMRPFIGGQELINDEMRWCIWLAGVPDSHWLDSPGIRARVEAVREWRSTRARATTRALANTPSRFAEIRQPTTAYLAFPTLSSEKRSYIPIAYLEPDVIASNQVYVIEGASLQHFGVLTSAMHMAWVRAVCGRLESRYRYSAQIVYNNFPWPTNVDERELASVEAAAKTVSSIRTKLEGSMADWYDDANMDPALRAAHERLDRAVERCYRAESFDTERARVEHLFGLHRALAKSRT